MVRLAVKSLKLFLCIASLVLFSWSAWGVGKVVKVKGRKLLIKLDQTGIKANSPAYVLANGKKAGLIVIKKVKGTKGLALLKKGRAKPGWTIELRDKSQAGSSGPPGKMQIGALAGFSYSYLSLTFPSGQSTTLTGSKYSVGGILDYSINPTWRLRLGLGMDNFLTEGSIDGSDCAGTSDCVLSVSYTSLSGILQWHKPSFWVGGGGAYMTPAAYRTSAVNAESIKSVFAGIVAVGKNFTLGNNMVPVQFDIIILPPEAAVLPLMFTLRAGYTFNIK